MDKFIKSQLEEIDLSSQRMAKEAHDISLRITAIFGYYAGQESGVYNPLCMYRRSTVINTENITSFID